jgi:hypothetical protein
LVQLRESLQTSDTTTRKALKRLIEFGYVSKIQPNLYKVNSFKTLIGNNTHEKFYKITDQELFSYSWKNISNFRAMLVEFRIQQNRNAKRNLNKGYTVIDRHGMSERIKSQRNSGFDTLIAGQYVADMTNKSIRTIYTYRRKQKLVKYSQKQVIKIKTSQEYKKISDKIENLGGKIFTFGNLLIFIPISERIGRVILNGY